MNKMSMILRTTDLCRKFQGQYVVENVSLNIKENTIYGLLGPNESGKSTTMKCLAGLYHPTSGSIVINGYDIYEDREDALSQMGVSIENPALYPNLTGKEHFDMVAKWKKLNNARIKETEDFSSLNDDLK